MAIAINYEEAKAKLEELFAKAEEAGELGLDPEIVEQAEVLFKSNTQSIREVALGCALAKVVRPEVDVTLPYADHGDHAFNGRTLDERVVNPFLHDRAVPCSKGPYLASFRRSVKLIPETGQGLRDKVAYTALLEFLEELAGSDGEDAERLVVLLLQKFIVLRDASNVAVAKIDRMSLEQIRALVSRLLGEKSGGLIPVLCTVATIATIRSCYERPWEISYQGINVADKASGVGGDVTVTEGGEIILSLEVTERPIEKARVVSTFKTKIALGGIKEYLFVYTASAPGEDAKAAAERYYSQGHEINFLQVEEWVANVLGTVGAKCRRQFLEHLTNLFNEPAVPAKLKVAWNDHVQAIVSA